MNSGWLQRELSVILVDELHSPFEALVAAWNKEMAEALDHIMPMKTFPLLGTSSTEELREGK